MPRRFDRSFAMLLVMFTVAYVLAVGADHLSTVVNMQQGATEQNFLFRAADGSLNQVLAVLVFIVLYPLFAASVWVGVQRARRGDHALSHSLTNSIIGRTARSALLGPIIVILAKSMVALLNLLNPVLPMSTSRLLEAALSPLGLWSSHANYLVTVSIIVGVAFLIARPIARRLVIEIRESSDPAASGPA